MRKTLSSEVKRYDRSLVEQINTLNQEKFNGRLPEVTASAELAAEFRRLKQLEEMYKKKKGGSLI